MGAAKNMSARPPFFCDPAVVPPGTYVPSCLKYRVFFLLMKLIEDIEQLLLKEQNKEHAKKINEQLAKVKPNIEKWCINGGGLCNCLYLQYAQLFFESMKIDRVLSLNMLVHAELVCDTMKDVVVLFANVGVSQEIQDEYALFFVGVLDKLRYLDKEVDSIWAREETRTKALINMCRTYALTMCAMKANAMKLKHQESEYLKELEEEWCYPM